MNVYMFHYIHKEDNGYKYYSLERFEKIIKTLASNNNILDLNEFNRRLRKNKLSSKDVLLTFDDGTIDHYENVYPILKRNNVSGTFFICNDSLNGNGLIPNKIHKLLANVKFELLFSQFKKIYDELIESENIILEPEKASHFDNNENVRLFKQALQYRLPERTRNLIIKELYQMNNITFNCSDYYITMDNIKEMQNNGMHFGLHTKTHKHLEYLEYGEQEEEIIKNIHLFKDNNLFHGTVAFAYPYGSFNENTIEILRKQNIDIAFLADNRQNRELDVYKLPRIDCKLIV